MANPNKYTEFPVDGNNEPVMSSTKRHLLVITGNDDWQDLVVPDGVECKELVIVARRESEAVYSHLSEGLEIHYRIDSEAGENEWVPLPSGKYPFAGQAGKHLGQLKVAQGIFLSVLMMA